MDDDYNERSWYRPASNIDQRPGGHVAGEIAAIKASNLDPAPEGLIAKLPSEFRHQIRAPSASSLNVNHLHESLLAALHEATSRRQIDSKIIAK